MRYWLWGSLSGRIPRPFYYLLLWILGACGQLGSKAPLAPTVEVFQAELPVEGENLLGLRLFRPGTGSHPLLASLEWEAPSGKRDTVEHRLQVPGGIPGRYALPYRLQEAGMHRAVLRLYDLERGRQVHAVEDLRLYARPAWELSADRSYYTNEGQIRFRLRRNIRDRIPIRATVELRRGNEVLERADLNLTGREVFGAFAVGALAKGRYRLLARLLDSSGGVDSLEVFCEKFAPADREVKIDLFSQTLLVDDRPFFPVGLYWLRADILAPMRRLHFNSGDYFYQLRGEEVAALMDTAAVHGMKILLELSEYTRQQPEPDYQAIEAMVERYRLHPALLAWYLVDEPDETSMDPATARAIYELIRELDPYHPVYLVNNRPHTYATYAGASDILAIDVYPIPRYPITRVRDYMQQARWTSLGQKPVWLVAQAFGGVEHWPRAPTAVELRNMIYQGLVQGASGVLFYRYCQEDERHIQPPALWREVQMLAAELAALSPVLMQAAYDAGPREVGTGVEAVIKEYEHDFYIFVVNVDKESRRFEIRLDDLPPVDRARVLYGISDPILDNGRLIAELEPLGMAVYRLEMAGI